MKMLVSLLFLFLQPFMLTLSYCEKRTEKTEISPGWALQTPIYGDSAGATEIKVAFPHKGNNLPLSFGIPLGQARDIDKIIVTDEKGDYVPASFVPLTQGNPPAKWYLVSTVLNSYGENTTRKLKISWGRDYSKKQERKAIKISKKDSAFKIDNGLYIIELTSSGIKSVSTSGKTQKMSISTYIKPAGQNELTPSEGTFEVIYDTERHKKIRFESILRDSLYVQQEYDLWYGSPFVKYEVRYINRSYSDIPLEGLSPLSVEVPGVSGAIFGSGEYTSPRPEEFEFIQRAFDNSFVLADKTGFVPENGYTDVWAGIKAGKGLNIMFFLPDFRGMASGEENVESVFSYGGGKLRATHYRYMSENADVRLRETMARTFCCWMVIGSGEMDFGASARIAKNLPYIEYDREYLTDMGVFQETGVSHIFDSYAENGALYFLRAKIPRAEYPRSSRGADPGYDGEGLYEVNLHAGGMVFGETYQYFTPKPDSAIYKHYRDTLKIENAHLITGGQFSYRNGDIPLALFQEYLRTGREDIFRFAENHTQLFSDYAVSHAFGPGEGLGHYYCDWYGNPYVYQRFEGLLLGYLVTGDRWFFESAEKMAEFTLRAWESGSPKDGDMWGRFTGVQSRSVYTAKMCLKMYDITGEIKYPENAVRLAEWAMKTQEPEGWWVMDPNKREESRKYRCTPIFTGYIVQGLWPLYLRTGNSGLGKTLIKAAGWYLSMQEDARGSNPGTFPNSYWYGSKGSEDKPAPVSGNYATTTHAANALLQAYLITGDDKYFYGANAAWTGILNNLTPEGGVPLENNVLGSVWSHVLVESLPQFGEIAENKHLPILLTSKTGVPGTSFMGKGATYSDGVFTFELKYKSANPLPLKVYFPKGQPVKINVGESVIKDFKYDNGTKIVSFNIPESKDFCVCRVELF